MPTARELLEQADALMRRNRKSGRGRDGGPPTLIDALGVDVKAPVAPTIMLPPEAAAPDADPISLDNLAEVPVLTDAVEDFAAGVFPPLRIEPDLMSAAAPLQPEPLQAAPMQTPMSLTARAAPAAASMPSRRPMLDEEFVLVIPPLAEVQAEAPPAIEAPDAAIVPIAGGAPESTAPPLPSPADWDTLAEEIRAQVLQRLDLFTDTGLREQLALRLRPIVDRASLELVDTINRELGDLIRGYVAEAIEREIETWRQRDA